MVPLKLALRNFMAYRVLDPPLDLTGIHVACLSGPNGAGKSTLVDAMTWALWGQARAKSDDELITLGESEMEVELEFAMGEERYRVIRKRTRGVLRRPGQSLLELQVADSDQFFRPLTGNTLRDTQRQIEQLLRLDYQTFINSALLLQGRADEFTLKAPGERKRVLGEVLGLARYDEFEELAREEARRRAAELQSLSAEIASMEEQVSHRSEYEAELQTAQDVLGQLEMLRKAQEGALAGFQEMQRLRAEKQARLSEAQSRAHQAETELRELKERETALLGRIQQDREILARQEEIEGHMEQHRSLAAANERLAAALQQLMQLREEASRLERTVESARNQVASEELLLQRESARLRELAANRQPMRQALSEAEQALATAAATEGTLAGHRAQLEVVVQRIGVLEHTNQEITRQGQELRAKVEQLNRPGATGVCPLCGTELGPEGHARIIQEYQRALEEQRELYRTNDRQVRALQDEQKKGQGAVRTLEERIAQEKAAAQAKAATAGQALSEADKATVELAPVEVKLATVQEALAGKAFAPEAQLALTEANARILGLGYDQDEHRTIQEQLRALEPWLAASQRLQEALRRLPEEEADLSGVKDTSARWQERSSSESELCAALSTELADLPDATTKISEAQHHLEATRVRVTQTSTVLGRVQAQIERCRQLEGILQERRGEIAVRQREKEIYDELTLAFGRRGIQALLIDTALPELEEEANRLLSQMTDNRMHLTLETQRQTRSGALTETLDIKISDELGTRAYELYSGGEAFRINFALRIAISKLLARRAGAPLPTLVLDEGFGTQDAAGREKLIEAVNAIAGDFQRVLVVTHIDELKDAFPVRIEVTKTPQGSKVEVV